MKRAWLNFVRFCVYMVSVYICCFIRNVYSFVEEYTV